MCLLCTEHGNGNKWYLNPKNYDIKVFEQKHLGQIFENWAADWEYNAAIFERMTKLNEVRAAQVVPLEEALKVVDLVDTFAKEGYGWFAANPCPCRKLLTGKEMVKCMDFGLFVNVANKPGAKLNLLSADEYKEKLVELDEQGFVHTIYGWGLKVGECFASTFCNCEAQLCITYRARGYWNQPYPLKSELVAIVNLDKCVGCGKCAMKCQFGALYVGKKMSKAFIDPTTCWGCGVCRQDCEENAIDLVPRSQISSAKNRW